MSGGTATFSASHLNFPLAFPTAVVFCDPIIDNMIVRMTELDLAAPTLLTSNRNSARAAIAKGS